MTLTSDGLEALLTIPNEETTMPPIPKSVLKTTAAPPPKTEGELLMEDYRAFELLFVRSQRGNLWHRDGNVLVTVFRHNGQWKWCIDDPEADEPKRWSDHGYDSEDEAIFALWELSRGI